MSALLFLAAVTGAPPAALPPAPQVAQRPVDPAALAAARRLLATLHVDQTLARMMTSLIPVLTTATIGAIEHNPAVAGALQRMEAMPNGRDRLLVIFSGELKTSIEARYPAIVDGAAMEYARLFSAQELDQLSAIFASGVGAKWIAAAAALQQSVGARAAEIGRQAGIEAGTRAMQRAARELLPAEETKS